MMNRKMHKVSMVLLFILIFTVSMTVSLFCQSYPAHLSSSYDYVALGDSYSAGQNPYGDMVGYGYADCIKDKLERAGILKSFHKKGVSGYTTTDLMVQLRTMKRLLYDADIVTIDIGINDILLLDEVEAYRSNPSSETFAVAEAAAMRKIPEVESNIGMIIGGIKAANPYFDPQIYIMGYFNAFSDLPAFLPLIEKLNTAINDAAMESNVTYVDTMAAVDVKLREYFPGDIHPTVEGYRAIAEEFWNRIDEDLLNIPSAYQIPSDINGHWAETYVEEYIEKGIVTGYEDGSFQPERSVTRAEFVTMMNRYFRLTSKTDTFFMDVPENAWYRLELQKAAKEGYISGYENNSFRPDEYITRQEAAVIVARKMKFELSGEGDETARFRDSEGIPAWSLDAFNGLIRSGILEGYPDNRIRYQGNLTRAEVLSILDKITAYIDMNAPNI